jgi:RNA polymerase sigma-70 factor (ECF subfamily)
VAARIMVVQGDGFRRELGLVESDEELVRRTRNGDRQAFSRLVERYEPPALAIATSVLRCSHEARDAVQDAFVTAYAWMNRLWSPRAFGTWFLRIARQQALLHLRRNKTRSRQLAAMVMHTTQRNESPPPDSGGGGETLDLIARLPEQECVVVSLRHLDERSVAEIAQITGRPIGTVTKQLSRAYARMRSWLDDAEAT